MMNASIFVTVLALWSAGVSLEVQSLAFAPPILPDKDMQVVRSFSRGPSVVISSSETKPSSMFGIDKEAIKFLEDETKAAEKEAARDERKARVEKSREAFFDYEAKMAAEQEARIEAAEKKALAEIEKDKEEIAKDKEEEEKIKLLEKKAEEEALLAKTKEEKAARLREAKELLRKEKEIERKEKLAQRKERKAERAERIFLAEETQEQIILQQKLDAERAEKERFEAIEKEYERAAEVAKEDEEELSLVRRLFGN